MLFSEVYSSYFNTVAEILNKAVSGKLDDATIYKIVHEKAFSESILSIPENIRDKWALVNKDYSTPIKRKPQMPLTILHKRWLRALLEDPRIKLFEGLYDIKKLSDGLEDIEPLFTQDMIVYYDQYGLGDPYDSDKYIENFRTILEAFRSKHKLFIHYKGNTNKYHKWECIPYWIEFSAKDNKFRLITTSKNTNQVQTINIGQVIKCKLMEPYNAAEYNMPVQRQEKLVLQLVDERNALERVMLNFSHLKKEAEHLAGKKYQLTMYYDKEDETEILIRVLSFGPLVKVVSPEHFIEKIKRRLVKQKQLNNESQKL